MAEHAELLAEMSSVGRLSATERVKHAQKRRAQQLRSWAVMEKENAHMSRGTQKGDREKHSGKERSKKVTFPSNITLLEAAARNDQEEEVQSGTGITPGDKAFESNLRPCTLRHGGGGGCCIDDFADVVRCLLEMGASVNACDSELWTPLHAAATCGHTGLVQLLVQAGADLLAVNADGNMPYDLCEDEATLELLEVVMAEQGITQERIDECRGAKEKEMLAGIKQLIEAGSDLNIPHEHGATLIHMVELLVAHGADLNAKSVLEETPLDVCVDEEVRTKMMELKHKHDAIMRSQERHKGTLQRRASSASSRGKVVRRTSVNERSSLYRREHHKEAMVWQSRGRQAEVVDDDEDRQTDAELTLVAGVSRIPAAALWPEDREEGGSRESFLGNGGTFIAPSSSTYVAGELRGGGRLDRSASYQLAPEAGPAEWSSNNMNREKSHHTLADLKRQRAAAKLQKRPAPAPPLAAPTALKEEPALLELGPQGSTQEAQEVVTPTTVYFTPASGDPPLLKLRAPEEETTNTKEPCCGLM
ncbi:hypothetical protein P4O66_001557 [Electrophorus voltai]|uniref:Protein phosphatase 1, regulatory subunit 16A n=1 Tax=Electrophorus voltai TaxID=2609070 RepID=A0AAD9DTX4_9TELE|nr:hypothetical protein P4O66_001557 [Electrophorus voltai]